MDLFVILVLISVIGSVLSAVFYVGVGILIAKAIRGNIRQWNELSAEQKAQIIRKLSTMPDYKRSSFYNDYMPVRDEMAGLAASNGIDPSFLYR